MSEFFFPVSLFISLDQTNGTMRNMGEILLETFWFAEFLKRRNRKTVGIECPGMLNPTRFENT
jgi:hypothetical protein